MKNKNYLNPCCSTNIKTRAPVLIDAKWREQHSGIVLGSAGSGKTRFVQQEIQQILSSTTDDVIVIDTVGIGEYNTLCERMGGKLINVANSTEYYDNPLLSIWEATAKLWDVGPVGACERIEDYVLALCGSALGEEDMSPTQKRMITRAVRYIIEPFVEKPQPNNGQETGPFPSLGDLREYFAGMIEMTTKEALEKYCYSKAVSDASAIIDTLDKLTTNFRGIFSQETNSELCSRVIVYNAGKNVSEYLKSTAALIALANARTQAFRNSTERKRTWIFIDDAHYIFNNRVFLS